MLQLSSRPAPVLAFGGKPKPEDDDYGYYWRTIRQYPLLSYEEEQALIRQIGAGAEAPKTKLINSHLLLVARIAQGYRSRGLPIMDVIQLGNEGLIRAVNNVGEGKYRPQPGRRFNNYAQWWIRRGITGNIPAETRVVRLPDNIVDDLNKLRKTSRELTQHLGRPPQPEELADALEITVEKTVLLLRSDQSSLSLEAPIGDKTQLKDTFHHTAKRHPNVLVEKNQMAQTLRDATQALSPRLQQVIRLHYGLDGGKELSLKEIGRIMGFSGERARQLKNQAIAELHKLLPECFAHVEADD